MIKLSIVIPTFNRAAYLADCIDSLNNQTLGKDNFEVIVVDDGSKDNTAETMTDLIQNHSWVKYFPKKNQGPASARNFGIKKAEGEWIAFLDDDCLASDNWIESVMPLLSDPGLGIVEGRTVPESTDIGILERTIMVDEGGDYLTCNIFYRKDLLIQVGGFDENFAHAYREDIDLAWRVIDTGNDSTFNKNAVVIHRTNRYSIHRLWLRDIRMQRSFYETKLCKKHADRFRERFAAFKWLNPSSVITYPFVFFTLLALMAFCITPLASVFILGASLVLYCYIVTVLLYFSIHSGIGLRGLIKEPFKLLIILSLWWGPLLSEVVNSIRGAVKHRIILF